MEESTKRLQLSTRPFSSPSQMEHRSSPPPLRLSTSLSVADPHPPSPSVFGLMISVIIKRIAHSTSAPIVVNRLPDTPLHLVLLPNATVAVDGDIPLAFVLSELAQFVINMGTWRMTVWLRHFLLNRQCTFMQVPLPLTPILLEGVLIEPGAQWYEGGNVTIFLLFHNLLLLVCPRHVHILFGMCRYDYASLLLVVHPSHSRMFILWLPHTVHPYYWKGIFLIFCSPFSSDIISTARLSRA